jgi:hypothetical protein
LRVSSPRLIAHEVERLERADKRPPIGQQLLERDQILPRILLDGIRLQLSDVGSAGRLQVSREPWLG